MKFVKLSFGVLLGIGCILLLYATCVEPFRLVVTNWTVETTQWKSSKPLKIAVLSDMHAIIPWMTESHLDRIINETNALHPDVVLLLGDYVATHPFGKQLTPEDGVRPYKSLKSACGTYAVIGNHDLHGSVGWPEALKAAGIPVLRNEVRKVDCEGQKFWVAGLDELWWGHADIQKIMNSITDSSPVILMMHNPDSFPETPEGIAVNVAGHTHGGQIHFPFLGAVAAVVPSNYGLRYAYGHIQEGVEKNLVVSSGLGMTGIPLRFLCPPEITMITLKNRENLSE